MRKNIQGITIEIGGDTTKLQNALRGVETKIKGTQAALRDVQKLLKLDPGNVELLRQKQQLLNDAYEASKKKLETLKEAEKQAADAAANGNAGAKARYDALQREIIETEQEMKRLSKEMKNFGSVAAQQIKAAGEKIKALGDKVQKVGTAMSKYVTGPIAAMGAASVAAFKEVDEGLDIIAKKTGATGEALQGMQESAKNLATSIPTDFTTAGNAVAEVNTRFGLTGEALEDLSAKFIKFADLNDTDVTSSIDSVQAAMAAFDIDASRAGSVLDVLNKVGQDTGTSVDQLSNMLADNAAQLRQMGLNVGQSAKFLGSLEKQGVDAGAAITGMRKAMQNAMKGGKSLSTAVSEYEKKIKSARNSTEAMSIATELFGSKAGPALGSALYEGRMSLSDISASMEEFAGSVENTFEDTLDPIDSFKTTLNELKIVGAEIVEAAAPMIKSFAQTVKNVVKSVRGWWEGLSPLAQKTIVKAAGIAAAIGPVILVVGKLTSAVGSVLTLAPTIVSVITTIKTAMSALWAVMAANPIVLIIAAIAALVAGFIYLWNNCEEFRQFWINLWENIKKIAKAVVDWIVNAWNNLTQKVGQLWDGIKNTVGKAVDWVKGAWDGLKQKAGQVWNGIKDTVSKTTGKVGEVLQDKWANIKKAYEEHGGGLKGVVAATWQAIKEKWTLGFDIINKLTGGKLDGIKQKFTDIFDGIKNFVKNALDKIKSFFSFDWELPKIKLPHFKIEGKFSLSPPQVPHLTIDWYKKAMQDGMILNSPTIFGASGNRLMAGGEAGPEAVVGVDSLRSMIQAAVGQASGKTTPRNITIILETDGTQWARANVPYIEAEVKRYGAKLATGGGY